MAGVRLTREEARRLSNVSKTARIAVFAGATFTLIDAMPTSGAKVHDRIIGPAITSQRFKLA